MKKYSTQVDNFYWPLKSVSVVLVDLCSNLIQIVSVQLGKVHKYPAQPTWMVGNQERQHAAIIRNRLASIAALGRGSLSSEKAFLVSAASIVCPHSPNLANSDSDSDLRSSTKGWVGGFSNPLTPFSVQCLLHLISGEDKE